MTAEKIGQIITKIIKEVGIHEYDPATITCLTDFTYNYATSVLNEAKNSAAHPKHLTPQDITFAISFLTDETIYRNDAETLKCARVVNEQPLPGLSMRYGLNLPPDRHCLTKCNYSLRKAGPK